MVRTESREIAPDCLGGAKKSFWIFGFHYSLKRMSRGLCLGKKEGKGKGFRGKGSAGRTDLYKPKRKQRPEYRCLETSNACMQD